jgi:uncharacterized protein (TIGR04141 family)
VSIRPKLIVKPSEAAIDAAAAFVTRTSGRFFVIVFGQGRHLIKSGACEDRFGLRVTLNSVQNRGQRVSGRPKRRFCSSRRKAQSRRYPYFE